MIKVAFEQTTKCLRKALSLRKLVFFSGGAFGVALVAAVLIGIAAQISEGAAAVTAAIVNVLAAGILFGVLPGGVAYMTHLEAQGRAIGIGDTIGFCGRRFLSLAAVVLSVPLVGLVGNGVIFLLNLNRTVGSFFGALLYLPQFMLNFCLVLVVVFGALLPCAIAVEGIGAVAAITRTFRCIQQHTGRMLIHLGWTALICWVIMAGLLSVVFAALLPTGMTNGGGFFALDSLYSARGAAIEQVAKRHFADLGSIEDIHVPTRAASGESLRQFFFTVICLLTAAYPVVYWITSFTTYYRAALPGLSTHGAAPRAPGP